MKYCVILAMAALSFACTKIREDHSLTLNEYQQMGIPAPGKIWNMEDISSTYYALMKIKWDKPYLLPTKDSENSGILFSRMVSPDNMYFLKDDTMALHEKAQRIAEFVRVYEYWIDLYTNPTLRTNYYGREIIAVHLFKLLVTQNMVELAIQINKSDDPADKVLQYGYKPIKENYINCLTDNLKMLYLPKQFHEDDLNRLADTLSVSILRNRSFMDSTDLNSLRKSFRVVLDSTTSDRIQTKFITLLKSI